MDDRKATIELLLMHIDKDGLASATAQELENYTAALCGAERFSLFGDHDFHEVSEAVRVHLLRAHIQALQSHITDLDTKNTTLSYLVLLLAIAAFIAGAAQAVTAILPYVGIFPAQPTASAPQKPEMKPSIPIQTAPPISGQPTKKAP